VNRRIIAIAPFAFIVILILIFYLSGLYHELSFDTIKREHGQWKAMVSEHPLLSALYFIGIYTLSVVLVIPDSMLLTLIGGFLFPLPLAIAYACISETLGATLFFLAIRLAYTETMQGKKKGFWYKTQKKFQKDQVSYLLFFRFSHLLPFWLINAGAGIFHTRTITFIWTTLIGVAPLAFFIAESGGSLSRYFETHTHFSLRGVFTPEIKIALIILGCMALLPIVYRKFRKHIP
jgi:uncharacterized membrane protein YdjX (TVP38/TMEM64 family)